MSKGELELSGLSGARLVCPGPASGVKSRFQSPGCLADDRWPQPVCGVGTALRGCWAGAGKTSLAGGLPSWREEMGPPGPFTCCPCPGPTHEGILASASPSPLPSEGATWAFLVGTLQRQEGHLAAASLPPSWNADVPGCVETAPVPPPPEDPYPLGVVLCGHQPDTLQPPSSACLFHLCVLSTQGLLSGVLGEAGALGTRAVHCLCVLSAGPTRASLHGSRSPVWQGGGWLKLH